MTEEQFDALKDLMEAIAYVATGSAIHQPRTKGIVEQSEQWARQVFDLPPIQEYQDETR